ncbi:dienelactone hydrolase family protein [Caballeronia sp. LZ034LL]|uniref:dienelactone hydrolase family protein n=1 Tax=Caballeronia sp. LZ034LL TaxID=3038567 RepID=UPI002857706F|nr:dienelactone hydrolase family protein [Caballeronia sp. LZ034LL]MDR5836028.1 dienelactone hydrolase family protein [Caballeronia sp. LZ034LL]
MSEWISLTARDGRNYEAYLAVPDETRSNANGRGLIILPEVYNVNAFARAVALRHAASGYTVLVPDLFWRQSPGRHYEYDQPDAAREQGASVDTNAVVSDVGVAADALRDRLGPAAAVGVIGYCLGGRLAALAGTRESVEAVVSYYGVGLDAHLDELAGARTPSLYLFGETDPWVPSAVVDAIQTCASDNGRLEVEAYAGAGHGFDRRGFPPYHRSAAEAAQARVAAFFDLHLR